MPKDLALIGCGRWGKHLARIFEHLGVLHSVCDTAQELDVIFNSSIKRVAIATPSHTHFELILMALRAGKDVFVEKPMCLNKEQAYYLCEQVQNSKQILMVGHLLRYHSSFLQLQNIVKQGLIGDIEQISAIRFNTEAARPEGVLLDLAVHDVSMALAVSRTADIQIRVAASQTAKQQEFKVVGSKGELIFDDLKAWNQKLRLNDQYISSPKIEPLEAECRHFLECCEQRCNPLTDAAESYQILNFLELDCIYKL